MIILKILHTLRIGCMTVLCFILAVVLVFSIKPVREYTAEAFWTYLADEFAKEEQGRKEKIERGEATRGRDTLFIWNDLYEIGKTSSDIILTVCKPGSYDIVLESIKKYKTIKGKLYLLSDDGYAVIDKESLCRVYFTLTDEELSDGHSVDEYGNIKYNSQYTNNPHVVYLSEFSDFSDEEQKIFKKLETEED